MAHEVELPAIEVLVRAAEFEVAVIAFFGRDDIHQGYDVVSGIQSADEVPAICALLQDAITALKSANWRSVDELHSLASEESDEPPF